MTRTMPSRARTSPELRSANRVLGALLAATARRGGALPAVVNNAGILRDRMFVNMDEAEWHAIIETSLKGR